MRSSFFDEAVTDALADHAVIDADSTVVDVGSSTGYIAAGPAPLAAPVIAVDKSPAMLAVAQLNLAALNIGNV